MKAVFDDIALYEGHANGVVTVDGSATGAQVNAKFTLDGISAQPFLRDATGFEHVAGTAKVDLALETSGANELQLVENLNGNTGFQFHNGAIVGFNVAGAVRGLSKGDFSGFRTAPSAKTDFSELSATFKIANGVAENRDLAMAGPLLRLSGSGTVHLFERTIDYTVKPKLVASIEGQESAGGLLNGIEVPVRISGSLDSPSYKVDINGALNSEGTAETIKEIGKHFKGKNAGEIVDELFGKKDGNGESNSKSTAKDFLNKLFKKPDKDDAE
jgi:AsmA protein